MVYVFIGFDDMDTHDGGCTTYVMYLFLKELVRRFGDCVVDLPRLVRLNPYVPFKTRGNAAVSVILNVSEDDVCEVIDIARWVVTNHVKIKGKTSPGFVYYVSNSLNIPEELKQFYMKALTDIILKDYALKLSKKLNIHVEGGRGIIGALASLGEDFSNDVTYEVLVYRDGEERVEITSSTLKNISEAAKPFTFLNVDEDGRVLIMPKGPDPVLFGIRGDSPYHVLAVMTYILNIMNVKYSGWIVYKTNQATNNHLKMRPKYRPYAPYITIGIIEKTFRTQHHHLVVKLNNNVKIIAYRHLGKILNVLQNSVGSLVEVWGGVKPEGRGYSLYLEGLKVLSNYNIKLLNPKCPKCNSRMKSSGKGRPLRCPKCKYLLRVFSKTIVKDGHTLHGIFYPRLSEFRHLMKPEDRFGIEGMGRVFLKPLMWIH